MAIFTTVLPNARRECLPPHYNVARTDIFFMLFVTAACLILDVATLAIFVIALFVYCFQAARSACTGSNNNSRSSSRKPFFVWRGKNKDGQRGSQMDNSRHSRGYDDEGSYMEEGIEVSPTGIIGVPNPVESATTILDKAENIIFPVSTTDSAD